MGLREYIEKRNFKETSEPETGKKKSEGKLKFVVQRHHASRLHYDFRLELDGVLKSWAVPKGPSLNPKDKRLAMMVEDHPYDYRTFEGIIPEGNYGAGVVTIFDDGTYEPISGQNEKDLKKGLQEGNLKFQLHGKILKGEFALVKLKGNEDNSWLLIKHRDGYAVDDKFDSEALVPESVKKRGLDHKNLAKAEKNKLQNVEIDEEAINLPYRPMLAKLSQSVVDKKDWIYERKLDGYRALAFIGKHIKLISRNGIDFTSSYKPVKKALAALDMEAVIDGELVVEDESGKEGFQDIQNNKKSNQNLKLKYYVFDLLSLNGHDTRDLDLLQRKELLKALIEKLKSPEIIYNEHVAGDGKKLFQEAREKGWEGIIAKDSHSKYESDKRSSSWQKFKFQNSQEAVIIGFSKPAGERKYFGSLILGMYENGQLVYIGNCGTGFTDESLKNIFEKLELLKTDIKPVTQKVSQERNVTWVRPELICEVSFPEWTKDKQMRHPVFKGLRDDKQPEEIHQEIALDAKETKAPSPAANPKNISNQDFPDEREESFGKKTLKLTNLNKLYWKKEGIKKGRLLEYYREISEFILPYLKDRPLSLNRHPNGIEAQGFFQKDLDTQQIPSWIKYQTIRAESNNKDVDYLICNDLPTLLWMVNLGCIEINPWLSTFKKIQNPVFAVMDLDPNDVADFREVIKVALTTKEILEEMGIEPYIKTSGSRGLHIFIHVGEQYDFEIVKNFVQYLGKMVNERHPQSTSLERSPSKRKNKIYLDFLQNRRGQTVAAPYSARPKPGATVSTPLAWSEVNDSLDIKAYTIFNTRDRIDKLGDLWKDITNKRADLKLALEKLK